MAIKIMLNIQDNLFDFWEVRSVEKGERYNDETEQIEYLIVINKTSISTNVSEIFFTYETKELRDEEMKNIKEKLESNDAVVLI